MRKQTQVFLREQVYRTIRLTAGLLCVLSLIATESSGWTTYSGTNHSYDVVSGGPLTWSQANAAAESILGPNGEKVHLVSITSAGENSFIAGLANNPAYWRVDLISDGPYIGLAQPDGSLEPHGDWRWTSGEHASYFSWHPYQPDDYLDNEDRCNLWTYALYGPGDTWNDLGDGPYAHSFIVETYRVSVDLSLLGYIGPGGDKTVYVEIWKNGLLQESISRSLADFASFGISPTTRGQVTMKFRVHTGLWKAVSVNLDNPLPNLAISLVNGDCDRDNEVGISDYSILSSSYGSTVGEASWIQGADLNGDDTVDIADYALLSANYGEIGD